MISTVGGGGGAGGGGRWRRAGHHPDRLWLRCARGEQPRGTDAWRLRSTTVVGVSQRELYLALGTRQGEPLGLFRSDKHRDHRYLNRLVVLDVAVEPGAGRQYLDIRQDELRRGVRELTRWAGRGQDVYVRARQDIPCDADHLVHPHRDRPHPRRNAWRQSRSRAHGGQL